jgi:hypothetical protein
VLIDESTKPESRKVSPLTKLRMFLDASSMTSSYPPERERGGDMDDRGKLALWLG